MNHAKETLKANTIVTDLDSLHAMKYHATCFAEYLTDNHKYIEWDGWKDINGKGETLTINEIYKQFNENKTK